MPYCPYIAPPCRPSPAAPAATRHSRIFGGRGAVSAPRTSAPVRAFLPGHRPAVTPPGSVANISAGGILWRAGFSGSVFAAPRRLSIRHSAEPVLEWLLWDNSVRARLDFPGPTRGGARYAPPRPGSVRARRFLPDSPGSVPWNLPRGAGITSRGLPDPRPRISGSAEVRPVVAFPLDARLPSAIGGRRPAGPRREAAIHRTGRASAGPPRPPGRKGSGDCRTAARPKVGPRVVSEPDS